jgi:hypothetical protein
MEFEDSKYKFDEDGEERDMLLDSKLPAEQFCIRIIFKAMRVEAIII